MLRHGCILLLLLNYLLVVGTGCVGRTDDWEQHRPQRTYVHSASCQRDHQLRLDCFDRCNGDQQRVLTRRAGEDSWQHSWVQVKGPDVHCLAETALLPPRLVLRQPRPTPPRWVPALAPGASAEPEAPPRIG